MEILMISFISGIIYIVYSMMRHNSQKSESNDNELPSQGINIVAKPQKFDNPNKLNPYS